MREFSLDLRYLDFFIKNHFARERGGGGREKLENERGILFVNAFNPCTREEGNGGKEGEANGKYFNLTSFDLRSFLCSRESFKNDENHTLY